MEGGRYRERGKEDGTSHITRFPPQRRIFGVEKNYPGFMASRRDFSTGDEFFFRSYNPMKKRKMESFVR